MREERVQHIDNEKQMRKEKAGGKEEYEREDL